MIAANSAVGVEQQHRYRPNCWLWARNQADLGPCPSWALRRIPRHAPLLLSLLCRHTSRWLWVDYARLSRQMGISHRRVRRCMLALREAGLVEFRVRTRPVSVLDPGQAAWLVGHGSQSWARPLASCMQRSGGAFALYVPEGFLTMAEKRNTRGGSRPGAGRPRKSNRSLAGGEVDEVTVTCDGGPAAAEKSNRSPLYISYSDPDPLTSAEQKGSPCDPRPGRAGMSDGEDRPSPADLVDRLVAERLATAPFRPSRQPIPEADRGPTPRVPDLDQPTTYQDGWRTFVPEGADPEVQVAAVVRGYNAAARRVYGDAAPVLFGRGGDVSRSRVYPQLLRAAAALLEHAIAPSAWAEWRMRQAVERGEERPWGVSRVMQPATIHKLRGLFRRQYDGPVRCARFERVHIEQMLRAREAWARWRWGEDPPMSSTRWYGEMRRSERARGFLDPLDCWPRPGNAPRKVGL